MCNNVRILLRIYFFPRIYKLFGTYYCIAQVSALQPTSIGFLKIDVLQDVPFSFYVEIFSSFWNGRGPWRNLLKN